MPRAIGVPWYCGPDNSPSHPENNRPRFGVVHHCGEAAPNVSPLGHGRMIPCDGGGVVLTLTPAKEPALADA